MWLYIWLAVTALAVIIEFCTSEMVTIWFAGGGLISMILAGCGVMWQIQLPVFVVISLVLLLSFRKITLKYLMKNQSHTNADAAIDKEYELITGIEFNEPGTIKVNGVTWNATTEKQGETIPAGVKVRVKSIKGNKYIVEKAE